jgi:hypothetical protein
MSNTVCSRCTQSTGRSHLVYSRHSDARLNARNKTLPGTQVYFYFIVYFLPGSKVCLQFIVSLTWVPGLLLLYIFLTWVPRFTRSTEVQLSGPLHNHLSLVRAFYREQVHVSVCVVVCVYGCVCVRVCVCVCSCCVSQGLLHSRPRPG